MTKIKIIRNGPGQKTLKKKKNYGKYKLHQNRVERPKKEEVEKLPLYKVQRKRNLLNINN